MNNQINTTCQICGRAIKTVNITIAHHGYMRPGDGRQTASCFGARHLPYEESRDLIIQAIESLKSYIEDMEQQLEDYMNCPPKVISELKTDYFTKIAKIKEYYRPENFDPTEMNSLSYFGQEYERAFKKRVNKLEKEIKYTQMQIEYLTERYNGWVAPAK